MPIAIHQSHCRWMIRRDMEDVIAIELASFSEPWELEDYLRFLRRRNSIGHIIESSEGVIYGAMVYTLNPRHLHVDRLVVHPCNRQQGYGSEMIDKLKGKLSTYRRSRITIDVDDGSLEFCRWLAKRDFRAVRIEAGVVRMEYRTQ